MASYGNQHNLTDDGTILGCIRRDSEGWRYLHAVEALIALGITSPASVPRSQRRANTGVGNSISESHALIGLIALLESVGCNMIDAPLLIQMHTDQCFSSDQIDLKWDENWIEIKPKVYFPDRVEASHSVSSKRSIDQCHTTIPNETDLGGTDPFDRFPVTPCRQGLALSWQGIRVQLDFDFNPEHLCIQGKQFVDIRWKTDYGVDWTIKDSLQCVSQLHTCDDVNYNDVAPQSLRVVRRTSQEIQWQDARFTPGSTFEDVRRAEQILAGPSVKVSIPFDKSGDTIDESRTIEFGDTAVFHMSDVGNRVFVELCKDDKCTRIFGSKGGRLFQFFQIPIT